MALTVQNGSLVVRDGKLGTGQGCCCGGGPCDVRARFQGQGAITGPFELWPTMCATALDYVREIAAWLSLVAEWMEENGYRNAEVFNPQTEVEPLACDPSSPIGGLVIPYSIWADCCGVVPLASDATNGINSGKWLPALDLLAESNIDTAYSYAAWTEFLPPMIPPCIENPLP